MFQLDEMKILGIIQSFFELTFRVVLAPRAKVLFYYPQHFNRSAEGTNPFFDAMLETCQRHGISYKLIEEPDWGTDKPRNGMAIKGDAFWVLVLFLRKVTRIIHKTNTLNQNDSIIAPWINILTMGKLRYEKYISISGSMEGLFLQLNKKGVVFEMQHGVDYSNKVSYFRDGEVYEAYKNERWHLLSWGDGYRDCVIHGHEIELSNRVHVVGCPINFSSNYKIKTNQNCQKIILISLQFTDDWTDEYSMRMKKLLIHTLEQLSECGYIVQLKHHPRYNNSISLDDIYRRFPFVRETRESVFELQHKTFLHITFYSTTAFEFAAAGVSTYFIRDESFPKEDSIFYGEYKYPLYWNWSIKETINFLHIPDNYRNMSTIVTKWYAHFYSPYNELGFLHLINR